MGQVNNSVMLEAVRTPLKDGRNTVWVEREFICKWNKDKRIIFEGISSFFNVTQGPSKFFVTKENLQSLYEFLLNHSYNATVDTAAIVKKSIDEYDSLTEDGYKYLMTVSW